MMFFLEYIQLNINRLNKKILSHSVYFHNTQHHTTANTPILFRPLFNTNNPINKKLKFIAILFLQSTPHTSPNLHQHTVCIKKKPN